MDLEPDVATFAEEGLELRDLVLPVVRRDMLLPLLDRLPPVGRRCRRSVRRRPSTMPTAWPPRRPSPRGRSSHGHARWTARFLSCHPTSAPAPDLRRRLPACVSQEGMARVWASRRRIACVSAESRCGSRATAYSSEVRASLQVGQQRLGLGSVARRGSGRPRRTSPLRRFVEGGEHPGGFPQARAHRGGRGVEPGLRQVLQGGRRVLADQPGRPGHRPPGRSSIAAPGRSPRPWHPSGPATAGPRGPGRGRLPVPLGQLLDLPRQRRDVRGREQRRRRSRRARRPPWHDARAASHSSSGGRSCCRSSMSSRRLSSVGFGNGRAFQ